MSALVLLRSSRCLNLRGQYCYLDCAVTGIKEAPRGHKASLALQYSTSRCLPFRPSEVVSYLSPNEGRTRRKDTSMGHRCHHASRFFLNGGLLRTMTSPHFFHVTHQVQVHVAHIPVLLGLVKHKLSTHQKQYSEFDISAVTIFPSC